MIMVIHFETGFTTIMVIYFKAGFFPSMELLPFSLLRCSRESSQSYWTAVQLILHLLAASVLPTEKEEVIRHGRSDGGRQHRQCQLYLHRHRIGIRLRTFLGPFLGTSVHTTRIFTFVVLGSHGGYIKAL